ncbi:MAG: hypothetical protein LBD98_00235 [Endomicrobium sp.]|jgi:hypothetical protein|nr:hypothetical protein [Endomicrobium sp.]
MKKFILAVALFCSFGVGSAFADFLGIGRAWENIKRETTRFAHDVGRETGDVWENVKRETTNAFDTARDVGDEVEKHEKKRKKLNCIDKCVGSAYYDETLRQQCEYECNKDL